MDNIFIMGGRDRNFVDSKSCLVLNTNNYRLNYNKTMNRARQIPASTVFEGRVVVSGGLVNNNDDSNTVEVYDHVANIWSYMPNMIYSRSHHSLVAVRNKLYVFGGFSKTCEVFDSSSNKFSILKTPSSLPDMGVYMLRGAVSVGKNILIFMRNSRTLVYFDFEKSDWSEKPFDVTKEFQFDWFLKIPKM